MPKIIYYDKNKKKKNKFFENFREISVVGSLNTDKIGHLGLSHYVFYVNV